MNSSRISRASIGAPRQAFTIVELLVVISVIGLLIALLVPALRGARSGSLKTDELNNLRQHGQAWNSYSTSNDGYCLPGWLDHAVTAGGSVQELWNVTYEFPDRTDVQPEQAAPYTWRLLPYLDYSHELVHRHLDDDDLSQSQVILEANEVAYQPAFGYNGYYIGGWWEMGQTSDGEWIARSKYTSFTSGPDAGRATKFVLRSIAHVPTDIIVFCSSTQVDAPGSYKSFDSNQPGWHMATPPILAHDHMWQSGDLFLGGVTGGGSAGNTSGNTQDTYSVQALWSSGPTAIPLGRYTKSAAICKGDGSVGSETPGALADQRKWVPSATGRTFEHDP